MKNLIRFLIFLIVGFIIGTVARDNLILGIVILLFGFFVLLWTFYKNQGWFKEKKKEMKLFIFLSGKIIGFILGIVGIIKINKEFAFFLIAAFSVLFVLYVCIKSIIQSTKIKKKS